MIKDEDVNIDVITSDKILVMIVRSKDQEVIQLTNKALKIWFVEMGLSLEMVD